MKESKRNTRVFASKHVSGMCGVGKFMARWTLRDNNLCPRCRQLEDAPHVWVCKGCDSDTIWRQSLEKLEQWMNTVDTNPDIQHAILYYLQRWRDYMHETYEPTFHISILIQEQESIGWRRFFEGWIHHGWHLLQSSHYKFLKSRRSGKRWVVALIKKQWEIAWDMWEHRNGILHEKENVVSLAEAKNR
jgi:hypothetical protein